MTQARHPTIRTFNPGTFQSDEEVIQQFVVREHELATVLEILRGNVDVDSCQHTLIVAPRGRGKTMLLARVAAELRINVDLSTHLLPVRFMEESHEIFSAADFWLDVLFYLSLETRTQDAEFARNLQDTHADLTTRWRERELDERARAAVLDVADRLGKRLVLMVENLQGLCDNVDDDFGWKLRKALQTEPQIILLASATSRFEGLDDAQDPFFELFRIISLQPLDTEQCRRLWQAVSGDAVSARRIRALQVLTGGDPRLLVIVAEFQRHGSIRRLMEQLVQMIDDHTEYFRGHLETLGKTERRVYLALMDLWKPSTTGEISSRARLDVRTVSTMLGRLVLRGAVDPRDEHGRYAVTQRLYRIYYKLRRERDEATVVQELLRFMDLFYRDTEITEWYDALHLDAFESPMILEGDLAAAIAEYDELIQRFRANSDPKLQARVASAMVSKGHLQGRLGDHDAEIETYDTVVDRYDRNDVPEIQVEVAGALYNKGVTLTRSSQHRAAIMAYDTVITRYGASDAPELERRVARALLNKGVDQAELGKYSAAIATFDTVADRYAERDEPELQERVARSLVFKAATQHRLNDADGSISTCDHVLAIYGERQDRGFRVVAAGALLQKCAVLGTSDRHAEAIATANEVVANYVFTDDPELQHILARTMNNKSESQRMIGEFDAALATSDQIVDRFGGSRAPELRNQVQDALFRKGMIQSRIGRAGEALRTSDEFEWWIGETVEGSGSPYAWKPQCIRMFALIAQGDGVAATESLCSVYAALVPEDEAMISHVVEV